jgi:hypothetical protein
MKYFSNKMKMYLTLTPIGYLLGYPSTYKNEFETVDSDEKSAMMIKILKK